MANDIYIGLPLIITFGLEIIFPFLFSLGCPGVWFAPPKYFCALVYLAICVLIGFTLKDADRIKNNDIFVFTWVLLAFNILWPMALKRHYNVTLVLLFLTLLVAYYVYNEIFLSKLTEGENTLYLNLYSTLIVWLGFTITMVFEFGGNHYKNMITI
jgi:hypothetical protein